MNVKITPGLLSGSVEAISSKSDVHRILLCSVFCKEKTTVHLRGISEDIMATASCLREMGAEVLVSDYDITVIPPEKYSENPTLDFNECGTTARFMLPAAAVLCGGGKFLGRGRLTMRPFSNLTREMRKHGCDISSDHLPMTASGRLKSGVYELEGNVSSQYFSSLLMALSALPHSSEIVALSEIQSLGYIDMTVKTLRDFGIKIEKTDRGYRVLGGQKFVSPREIYAEGDWSNGAFWIGADYLCGNVEIKGLSKKSLQGDRKIRECLESLKDGCVIDGSEIPDLIPIISVCACKVSGDVTISNSARLRLKESDRIKTTVSLINSLGGFAEEMEDGLIIHGTGRLFGGTTEGYGDHRIVMSGAIASVICENEVEIKGCEAVNKSYPSFFEDFKSLGGKINV